MTEALGEPLHPDGNISIDEVDNIVQNIIDDLQRDENVRALLNGEEFFQQPAWEDDEGIAMDMEIEIDELFDLRLEEGLTY